jgi:8-oxo-dGTP diphosphatase
LERGVGLLRIRGAVVVIADNCVALIKRTRGNHVYYLFPGGGVEGNETPEDAAIREAYEELGVRVRLDKTVAIVRFGESVQYYFKASIVSGELGTGTGAELYNDVDSETGSYQPILVPISEIVNYDVRPKPLAHILSQKSIDMMESPLLIEE